VKPAPFTYVRVASVEAAVAWLARGGGEARLLAGGQSLVPMMNMRLVRPAVVVDVNGVPGLDGISPLADGGLSLGALVRHEDLLASPVVADRAPLLAAAAAHVGHRAIRNRGTLGGSLAHADPAAELPAAVVALDARLAVAGPGGVRHVAAADFFVGLFATALAPDEMLTAVVLPAPAPGGWSFAELARRPGDFALAGVAGVLEGDVRGGCARARLVAFGAGDRPLRLAPAEALLAGARVDEALARRAGEAAAAVTAPLDDVHAGADYRRHLVAVLTERVVLDAWRRLVATPPQTRPRRTVPRRGPRPPTPPAPETRDGAAIRIRLTVNGVPVDRAVADRRSLADLLREDLGSPAPTSAASTACAAPAPCSWTAAARGRACSSPPSSTERR